MENRAYAIAVGLFTILLGCFLLFSFWWLNGAREDTVGYQIASPLPVTGLSVESAVRFRGVNVGKVTGITLDAANKSMILVDIQVQQGLPLTHSSYAELRLQGITGLASIELDDDGTSTEPLEPGATIPRTPSLMDELLRKGPDLAEQLSTLLTSSNTLVDRANRTLAGLDQDKLERTLSHLEQASARLEPVLNEAAAAFNQVGELASGNNQILLRETLAHIRDTAAAAQPLFAELHQSAQDFRVSAQAIQQDSHQLALTLNNETLPSIHALTASINRELRQFGALLDTLEENPQSLIFGKSPARPGPGEAGFDPGN